MSIEILSIQSHHLIVGRAATALYLIAETEKLKKEKVLFPCNICYAAVYPFIYAGCVPIFCDVDPASGNLTMDLVASQKDFSAVVVPHMYGNPVQEIQMIKQFCCKNGILMIEDCASAMGARVGDATCGSFGDYSIFSMGYSKTIDIGGGGIVISDRDISKMEMITERLPEKTEAIERDETFFGKMYRLIRNNPNQQLSKYIWDGLKDNLRHIYIYKCSNEEKKKMVNSLRNLESIMRERRREYDLYAGLINGVKDLKPYVFSEGAVPWRFCVFTHPNQKEKIISEFLKCGLPVSDWYPVVVEIFGDSNRLSYRNAVTFEERILNFPLLISDGRIKEICNMLRNIVNNS